MQSRDQANAQPSPVPYTWGAPESAAATLLFSVPALILILPELVRGGGGFTGGEPLDAASWILVAAGLAAALALTLAAKGVAAARLLISIGLSTSFVWFLIGWLFHRGYEVPTGFGGEPLAAAYRPLVIAALAAHLNLLPLVLLEARKRVRLTAGARARSRRCIIAVAASAIALDLTPLVWLLPEGTTRTVTTLAWLGAAIAVGGTFTFLAAREISVRKDASDPDVGRVDSDRAKRPEGKPEA